METYSNLASVCTVVSFVVFIGILFWAYSGKRKEAFSVAANEPFALPDDPAPTSQNAGQGLQR